MILPSAREILLRQIRPRISTEKSTELDNRPSGDDAKSHSLQRFLELLMAGHPMAIELLFAPGSFMLVPPHPLWREVQALGPRLVTRRAGMFLRYCHQHAEKFGQRAERVATAKRVLAVLLLREATHGTAARLELIGPELEALAGSSKHIALVDISAGNGPAVRHLEVCGRKAPFTATIRVAREMTEGLLAAYGRRAREAARQDGLDWKALSHAVRIGREAIELFGTGRLSFPLACRERLLAIKLGEVPYREVTNEIGALLGEVEQAAAASVLPERSDRAAAEALILRAYRRQVLESVE